MKMSLREKLFKEKNTKIVGEIKSILKKWKQLKSGVAIIKSLKKN